MSTEQEYPAEPSHPMPADDEDTEEEEEETKTMENLKCGSKTCTILAHNKMVLHALKHTNRSVFGLLVGVTYKSVSNNSTYIHVMDAIPLQHNFFSAMVVELAFLQITTWLEKIAKANGVSTKNLRIVGVYYSNYNSNDVSKNTSALIIASQIIREYSRSSTLLCQITSDRIQSAYDDSDSATDWYMVKNNGDSENRKDWRDVDDLFIVKTDRKNIKTDEYNKWLCNVHQLQLLDIEHHKFGEINLKNLLKNKREESIYDFEDHLDDQTKDWRNINFFNQ